MKLRWEQAALISVLLLAGVLRLGFVGVNPFGSDEARVSLLALKMARQGEIAINGISSSTGARNLPASIYAFVPPYALSTDPIIATQWVGLWSLLAVLLLTAEVLALRPWQALATVGLAAVVLLTMQQTIGRPLLLLANWFRARTAGRELVLDRQGLRELLRSPVPKEEQR